MTKETAIKGKLFSFGVFYQPQVCEREWRKESDFLRHFSRLQKIRKSLRYRKWMSKKLSCLVLRTINWKLKTRELREGECRLTTETGKCEKSSRASVEILSVWFVLAPAFARQEVTFYLAPSLPLETDLNFFTLLCHFTSIQLRCKVDKWVGIKRTVFSFSLLFICLIRRQPEKAQKGSF